MKRLLTLFLFALALCASAPTARAQKEADDFYDRAMARCKQGYLQLNPAAKENLDQRIK